MCELIFLTVVGAAMIARGLRGKRIDLHRICARCGYDLHGLPSPTNRCPECGAVVVTRHGLAIGNRRPRPWLIFGGCAVLFVGLVWGGLSIAHEYGQDYNRYKPLWMLRMEARQTFDVGSGPAIREILVRIHGGNISGPVLSLLMEESIGIQAQRGRLGSNEWGDIVVAVLDRGAASQAQIDRFVAQAIGDVRLEALPVYRRD